MLRIWDRVKETTTTTGTGALALAGAMTAHITFAAVPSMAVNDTCYCCVQAVDGSGVPTGDWQVALYTYSAANQLTHTTFLASSTGSAVSWAAGTKQVMLVNPAAVMKYPETLDTTPVLANFTWVNQGSATAVQHDYGINLSAPRVSSPDIKALVINVPTAPYVITARMKFNLCTRNYVCAGFCWYDGTKIETMGIRIADTVDGLQGVWFSHIKWNTVNSYNSTGDNDPRSSTIEWMRIGDDNTNRYFEVSVDGIEWIRLFTVTRTTFSTPTKVGIAIDNETVTAGLSTISQLALLSWKVA